jgi:hypothetical protein
MVITEVQRELYADRYTVEGLRSLVMHMACTDPDRFRDATRDMDAHMIQYPDSRKVLTVQNNGDDDDDKQPCPTCGGTGEVGKSGEEGPCGTCGGSGEW